MEELSNPKVDFLILADRAEAVNGKLYMMGGAWDRIWLTDFAQPQNMSIAIGIVVPWNATNIDYELTIRVESQDGVELASVGLVFNTGRPPILAQGDSQRLVFAFHVALRLTGPGTYVIKPFINDQEVSPRTVFHAHLLSMPRLPSVQ